MNLYSDEIFDGVEELYLWTIYYETIYGQCLYKYNDYLIEHDFFSYGERAFKFIPYRRIIKCTTVFKDDFVNIMEDSDNWCAFCLLKSNFSLLRRDQGGILHDIMDAE